MRETIVDRAYAKTLLPPRKEDGHKGDFGKLSVGVLPLFGSVLGADGLFRAIDPIFANYTVGFGSGHVTASNWTRVDNAVSYVSPTDRKQAGIEIHSGRNRVVRRIFESLGYHVVKLDRVYFAGLTKKNLPRGRWRYLTQEEVNFLKQNSSE